jgi:exonuclease-1
MGISNLYKFLAPCVKDGHIRELRGKTIAVDMPCWVHRGAIADAQKIVMGGNQVGSAGYG